MPSNKINWERKLPSNRYIDNSGTGYAHISEMQRLETTPTVGQKKYFVFLAKTCEANGLLPSKVINTRESYDTAINIMKRRLKEAGVEIPDTTKKKNRKYKFDKDGNVVEIATGKIKERRSK